MCVEVVNCVYHVYNYSSGSNHCCVFRHNNTNKNDDMKKTEEKDEEQEWNAIIHMQIYGIEICDGDS